MKGIMPAGCRILGYALLILSVFAPLGMYMSGQVNDGNLAIVKLGMKLVIWLSLFMIFLAKHKEVRPAGVGSLLRRGIGERHGRRRRTGSRQLGRHHLHGAHRAVSGIFSAEAKGRKGV